jgi:acyl carrier protein
MELIRQEIRNFILKNYWFNEQVRLNDDDSFMELGIIDSTGILELVSFLQETYSIEIDEELSPENLDSISRVTDFVSRKLAKAGGHPVGSDLVHQDLDTLVPLGDAR